MPTLAHGLIVAMRITDRGFEKFDTKWKIFAASFVLGILSLLACQFLLISWQTGIGICIGLILIIYACV